MKKRNRERAEVSHDPNSQYQYYSPNDYGNAPYIHEQFHNTRNTSETFKKPDSLDFLEQQLSEEPRFFKSQRPSYVAARPNFSIPVQQQYYASKRRRKKEMGSKRNAFLTFLSNRRGTLL